MANYELGNLIWRIKGDSSDYDKKIKTTSDKLNKFGDRAKKVGKSLTTFLTAPLVGLGVAGVKAASDLEESLNAVNVVFGDSSDIINQFGENAAENVGLSQAAFNGLATTIGSQLKQSGLSIDEVAGQTNELTTRAADLASVFNTEVDDALGALGSALRGEAEPVRRFGVNISNAAVQAEALASGLVSSKDQIDEQIKVQARYNIIMKQSAQVQGDFANTSDSLANQTRILKSDLTNVAAELGGELIPIATELVGGIRDAVDTFGDFSESTQSTIVKVGGFTAAIGPALIGVGSLSKALAVLNTTCLASPAGLIFLAGSATVAVLELAKAEQEASLEAGTASQLIKDQASSLDSFATAAGGAADSQEIANDAAKIAGQRYTVMAEKLTELETRTRNAARAAEVAGMRYEALAKSLGATVEEKVLTSYQKQIDSI